MKQTGTRQSRKHYLKLLLVAAAIVVLVSSSAFAAGILRQGNASNDGAKRIALTFDDGPYPEITPAILKALEEADVKATFFVVGWRVYEYHDIFTTMNEKGHEVGNHSYDHPHLTSLTAEEIASQLKKTNYAVQKYSGKKPVYLRPPYGSYNDLVLEIVAENDMKVVLWSLNPEDWASPGVDVIISRVLEQASDGSVVLLHDTWQTAQMLPELITTLKERGYVFVTLSELFAD